MSLPDNWHCRTLQAALSEQPSLSLDFYSYGVMLRKREGDTVTEYAVNPAQVAVALATKITFDTDMISGDTLLVRLCVIVHARIGSISARRCFLHKTTNH